MPTPMLYTMSQRSRLLFTYQYLLT
jgi:hypothetical protein